MDVNGSPMWVLSGRAAFGLAAHSSAPQIATELHYRDDAGHVRLARQQPAPALAEDEAFARLMTSTPSPISDPLGSFAWWNPAAQRLEASGFAPGSIELPLPDVAAVPPTDFAFGSDDVIYMARDGALIWRDLRERWDPAIARLDGFSVDLIAPLPGGGVWALDRSGRRLAKGTGYPLRHVGLRDADPSRFDPVEPNPDPPRLLPLRRARIPSGVSIVAIATSPEGKLALLGWESGELAAVFTLEESGVVERFRLTGLRFPYAIAWQDEDHVAVLASDGAAPARQAFVYAVDTSPTPGVAALPDGRVHPLLSARAGKFCNALGEAAQYLMAGDDPALPSGIRPLRALSGGAFAREGQVLIGPVDSATVGCVWHRLYVDAAVPEHGTIRIEAWASDGEDPPPADADWAPHIIARTRDPDLPSGVPYGAWCADSSEVPFAPNALACEARPGTSGLFTVLLQHCARRVRRIEGRCLWLRVTLTGDSQTSPELAAIRVYAQRFSYRDRYLPAFYREALGGADARAVGPATQQDFMDRMLAQYEGVLTEIEGKVAASWLVTDPAAAPEAALPWIGQWIGIAADGTGGMGRLRQELLAAPHTAALNGTLGGLMAALEIATGGVVVTGGRIDADGSPPAPGTLAIARLEDIAIRGLMLAMSEGGSCTILTGGAVTRGAIVVIEGFRLRSTFATILGADLADEDDPLTLGMATSGNSFVGDTLILGDEARAELLALYRGEIDDSRADREAVELFYARLAHRVLVLVRDVADPMEFARLGDVTEKAVPAHVEARLHQAGSPLIVGAASLLGVDTYLTEIAPFETVRLGRSILGQGDTVRGAGQLDLRSNGPVPPPPVARADGPHEVWTGSGFTLSALRSAAARGRSIERHIWTWE